MKRGKRAIVISETILATLLIVFSAEWVIVTSFIVWCWSKRVGAEPD